MISGAWLSPWPTVAFEPVPVHLTILKPAVVFALTELVIEPSELAAAVRPPFQFHEA